MVVAMHRWSRPRALLRAGLCVGLLMLTLPAFAAGAVSSATSQSMVSDEGRRELPPLPAGLRPQSEEAPGSQRKAPPLPAGLGGDGPEPPPLPAGLGDVPEVDDTPDADRSGPASLLGGFTGFWEVRAGVRLQNDPYEESLSLAETRLQLSRDFTAGPGLFRVTGDLIYDHVADDHALDLERGQGWVDLRELYFSAPIAERIDLRAGRQVLTWGVGDLLFLNDLFPKDWNAFFVGRDVEYLKAPSDAVRLAMYSKSVNLDVVYTPRFDPDRYVDPARLSFFDPRIGRRAGRDVDFDPVVPDDWFADDEWALRLHRMIGGWELAGYGYRGYSKSPAGFDPASGRPRFPRLDVYGASLRGPVGAAIVSGEVAWYRSREDRTGRDPFVPNDQFRLLLAYERELVADVTLGFQYYLERTLDHGALLATLPPGQVPPDAYRHLLTTRLTWLTHAQNVTWSLFAFVSPGDDDAYLRGSWQWKFTDQWSVSAGFNAFHGRRDSSFFGQFENNSNAWLALRRGF